jgi:hypothetical protein
LPTVPQYLTPVDGVHEIAVQLDVGWPHTLAVPAPPQVSGVAHLPQSRLPPQPSPMVPQ